MEQRQAAVIDAIAADDDLRPYLSDFRYVLAETRAVPCDDLASERALRAGLAALTDAFGREVMVAILARLVRDLPDGHPLQGPMLEYIAQVYNVTEDTLRAAIREARPEREESLMTTLAAQWKQEGKTEGKAQGKAEGKAQGKAEGKAETVLEILEARFGAIDPARRERVMRLSTNDLSRLSARAITAATLDDALAGAADEQP